MLLIILSLFLYRQLDAFFSESAFALPYTNKYECKTMSHPTPIPSSSYAAVVAKNSPLGPPISEALLELNDKGS